MHDGSFTRIESEKSRKAQELLIPTEKQSEYISILAQQCGLSVEQRNAWIRKRTGCKIEGLLPADLTMANASDVISGLKELVRAASPAPPRKVRSIDSITKDKERRK